MTYSPPHTRAAYGDDYGFLPALVPLALAAAKLTGIAALTTGGALAVSNVFVPEDVPILGTPAYVWGTYLERRYDWTGIKPRDVAVQIALAERAGKVQSIARIVGNVPPRAMVPPTNNAEAKLKAAALLAVAAQYYGAPQLTYAARTLYQGVTDADAASRDPAKIAATLEQAAGTVRTVSAYRPPDPESRYLSALFGTIAEPARVRSTQTQKIDPVLEAVKFDQKVNPFAADPRGGRGGRKRTPAWVWWAVSVGGAALVLGAIAYTRSPREGA